jgi:intron-binding protein aquarius
LQARESQVGFLPRLVRAFLELVDSIPLDEVVDFGVVQYCERMLEFLIDLQAQLPTRRYTNALFSDMYAVPASATWP